MIGWLIYQQEDAKVNQTYIQWFLDEAKKQHIDMQLVYRECLTIGLVNEGYQICIKGKTQNLPDFIVNRSIDPLLQQFFSAQSVPIFNNVHTATIANHKAMTHLTVQKLNIPMMPTFFLQGRALPVTPPISYPCIVKPATGRGGEDISFIQHQLDWEAFTQFATHSDYILQSTEVQLGKDLRVFIIGKEIIAAVLRTNEHDFRANFKLGGTASLYELSDQEKEIIQHIISHFNLGLVGLDFLIGDHGQLIFNEMEDVVGSRILSEVTDINLLEKYITFIIKSVKSK